MRPILLHPSSTFHQDAPANTVFFDGHGVSLRSSGMLHGRFMRAVVVDIDSPTNGDDRL